MRVRHVPSAAGLLVTLLLAAALATAACDDDDPSGDSASTVEANPDPEPDPDPDPEPESEITPVAMPEQGFVYAHLVEGPQGGARSVYRVAVFDSEEMRDVAEFELQGLVGYPQPALHLAGDLILANQSEAVRAYAANGSGGRDVYEAADGSFISGIDVSPDGRTLAVTEPGPTICTTPDPVTGTATCQPPQARIVFVDLATGEVTSEVSQAEALEGFRGTAGPIYWWNDGSAVSVHGVTNSEAPGGAAWVTPDGHVRVSSIIDYHPQRPDGQFMATGELLTPCDLSLDRIEMTIADLADDRAVTSLRDETRLVSELYWSPDGAELLFAARTFTLTPPPAGSGATTDCRVPVEDSEAWAVLHTDGSAAERGVDPYAIFDRWYGDNLIIYTCQGERILDPAACIAGGAQAPSTVSFRGQQLASTTEFILIAYLNQ